MESIRSNIAHQTPSARRASPLKPESPSTAPVDIVPKESVDLQGAGTAAPIVSEKEGSPSVSSLAKAEVGQLSGTGFTTPVASAMAAALIQQNPGLSGAQAKDILVPSQDGPNASIAVLSENDTPQVAKTSTFGQVVKNESARANLLALLDSEKWQAQLEGSKLQSLRPELEKPGTDVKGLLGKALGALEGGYTASHMKRAIDKVGMPLADELGMSPEEKSALGEVSGLYDIGKLAVNESILNFDGKWPEDKAGQWFGQVSNHVHPEIVEPLLEAFDVSDLGKQAVMHHHERPNGWAYCKDKQTPAWTDVSGVAKVLGMADTVDAMQWRKANVNRPVEAKLDRATMHKFLSGDAEKGKVDGELVGVVFGKLLPE